jgi:putative serine protease PepD
MSEQTERIDGPEDTGILPAYSEPVPPPPPTVSERPHRSRGASAMLLTAALILGAGGGVAGAAAYETLEDEPATTTTTTTEGSTSGAVAPLTPEPSGDTATGDEPAPTGSAEAVASSVLPSVVQITVLAAGGTGGSGSGIILSEDGEILTNEHVVSVAEGGGQMTVSFDDGSFAPATVVGTDPVTDLAVIRAEGVSGLTPARIGDSNALGVGEGVVAIGSPFGLEATVTSGIVSSLNRPVAVGGENGDDTIYPAIQTDAAINPGNSGGPLVNLDGQVVGVNSSIRTSTSGLGGEGGSIGLGFAIPISKVLPIVEQLRNDETPSHARLGVTVSNEIEGGLATGAGIESVESGSAGDAAGLRSGDIVLKVGEEVITSVDALVATIRGYRPGDAVTLTVLRGEETLTIDATLDSDLGNEDS